MPKPSHREKILNAGLQVILEQGFCGASVRDIVQAAGAPQGSFTNHFGSKEAFGLEVLDLYFHLVSQNILETLRNDSLPPLSRLRDWIDLQIQFLQQNDMRSGCLIGNFSIEAGDHSEMIRLRIVEIFDDIQASIAYCLKAAVKACEISESADSDLLAGFLYSSLQGAILQSKAEHSPAALARFKDVMFSIVLK